MSKLIHIKRGLDLKLQGAVTDNAIISCPCALAAIEPADFPGFLPKLAVKEGDAVKVGSALLFDKNAPQVCLTSPIAGTVTKVERAERRRIVRVVVEASADQAAVQLDGVEAARKGDPQAIRSLLQSSGTWALMRQLPYAIVPKADIAPVNVFVTAFNSAPLAPSFSLLLQGKDKEIQAGADALRALTSGTVFYSTRPGEDVPVPSGVEHVEVEGPHPACLPSVQADHLAPVSKGDQVLLLDAVALARIGHVILHGTADWSTVIALCGSEVESPRYVATVAGAAVAPILEGDIKADGRHHRIIAGDVLTGSRIDAEGFLHYPYQQLTVIPEGDDVAEFMGWASISPNKLSVNRSFLSSLLPGKKFAPDARILGGKRAMILSGEYEKVFPMDVLPEYLI